MAVFTTVLRSLSSVSVRVKGAQLGTVAFEVKTVTQLTGLSSSSLPKVELEILDARGIVCQGELELFTPFGVVP